MNDDAGDTGKANGVSGDLFNAAQDLSCACC
jgi:hypothetical protein